MPIEGGSDFETGSGGTRGHRLLGAGGVDLFFCAPTPHTKKNHKKNSAPAVLQLLLKVLVRHNLTRFAVSGPCRVPAISMAALVPSAGNHLKLSTTSTESPVVLRLRTVRCAAASFRVGPEPDIGRPNDGRYDGLYAAFTANHAFTNEDRPSTVLRRHGVKNRSPGAEVLT